MNRKTTLSETPQKKHRDYGRILYTGFLGTCMTAVLAQPALAADTLWTKASEVAYHERIIKKLPDPPKRKDRI